MKALLQRLFSRPKPHISQVRSSQARLLAAIHASSFRRGWTEEEFTRLLLDPAVIAHRVSVGSETVGFIISRFSGNEAEILSVAVTGAWRGRGLAKDLLATHLRWLAGLGVGTVFLEVEEGNEPARRLYGRAGFHEVGRRAGYYARKEGAKASAIVLRRDFQQ